jgi:hypothetical protein
MRALSVRRTNEGRLRSLTVGAALPPRTTDQDRDADRYPIERATSAPASPRTRSFTCCGANSLVGLRTAASAAATDSSRRRRRWICEPVDCFAPSTVAVPHGVSRNATPQAHRDESRITPGRRLDVLVLQLASVATSSWLISGVRGRPRYVARRADLCGSARDPRSYDLSHYRADGRTQSRCLAVSRSPAITTAYTVRGSDRRCARCDEFSPHASVPAPVRSRGPRAQRGGRISYGPLAHQFPHCCPSRCRWRFLRGSPPSVTGTPTSSMPQPLSWSAAPTEAAAASAPAARRVAGVLRRRRRLAERMSHGQRPWPIVRSPARPKPRAGRVRCPTPRRSVTHDALRTSAYRLRSGRSCWCRDRRPRSPDPSACGRDCWSGRHRLMSW